MADHLAHRPDRSPDPERRTPRGAAPEPKRSTTAPEVEPIHLGDLLAALRRQWWLLLLGVLVGGAGAGYVIYSHVPQYRSTAVIRLEDPRQSLTGGLAGPTPEATFGRAVDPLLSQMEVLRSRSVAGAVVDSLGLRLQPLSGGFDRQRLGFVEVAPAVPADTVMLEFGEDTYTLSWGQEWARAPYGERVSLDGLALQVMEPPAVERVPVAIRSRDAAVSMLLNNLSARRRENTDVVEVAYVATAPGLARNVANAMVATFQRENARASQQESRRRRIFLEEQLAATDSALLDAQEALIEFRSREQVYSSSQKFAAEQAGLMGLEVRREELAADRRMYQSMLEALTGSDEEGRSRRLLTLVSAPGLAENPVISRLYEQLVDYEFARDSLVSGDWGSAPSNPDVQRLDRLLQETRSRLIAAVRSHVDAVDARLAALDELRERSLEAFETLPGTEAREARLIQQVETAQEMARLLRQEYQKARVAEAVDAGQVEIVDVARAGDPVGSGAARKLIFGIMLGLMVGGGAAIVRDRLNTSIRQKEDVERVLGLSPLGVVPRLDLSNGTRRSLPASRKGAGETSSFSRELVTLHHQRSSGAEAYRTLRTNLLFSHLGEQLKTVVVTSPGAAEGKTTVASNLATTFAQQGVRVLLVDADLRKARLHQVFGTAREPGMTEWLMGNVDASEAIRDTEVENLFVLPAGTLPPNPSELLGSDSMRRLITTLREAFELVIFDSPPLLAAGDAAVLGARTDGVVLVVRAGETEQGAGREAVRQLDLVRARILGAVLNDPDATVGRYGGYYQYEYYGE